MICMKGGFVVQRHNELRDLEAKLLNFVCKDAETEPRLQDIMGEVLGRSANTLQEARVDINTTGFRERQQSAFFDVWVCHPEQNHMPILPHNRFTANMKMKRYENMQSGFYI